MNTYPYTYDLRQAEQGFQDRPRLLATVRELIRQQDRTGEDLAVLLAAANIPDGDRFAIARVWEGEQ